MTITEDIRAIVERVKNLGPEWHHAAGKLEDAVRAAETARADRIAFMGKCIASTTDRLAKLKEEIRTLPEQIEKWEAERAHLEASTAVGLMMGDVKGGDDHRPDEPSKSADTDNAVESSDGPDVAPPSVGKAEGASNPFAYRFDGAGYQVSTDPTRKWYAITGVWEAGYRPHGKTRAEIEAMADAREKQEAEKPEPPALLDLRTLKVGDEVQLMEACHTLGGYRLVVGQKVRIAGVSIAEKDGSTWTVTPCVPARVVEVPR